MQKNVAGQKIGVQMVSASDGSAFTGAVTVSVTGDAGSQATGSVGSGACTHEGNGYHTYAPAQAETNYDLIAFTFTGSGAVPATVQVFTTASLITAIWAAVVDSSGITTLLARLTATRAGYLDNLSAGAVATAAKLLSYFQSALRKDVTVDPDIGGNYDDATDSQEAIRDNMGTAQTGDAYARLGAPAGASVSADIAAVKSQTAAIEADTQDLQAQIGTDGDGLEAIPWNASWDAEVQSEVADALAAYDPPTKAELDSAVAPLATTAALATVAGYVDTEVAAIKEVTDALADTLEDDGGTYRFTANALEQAPSGGGGSSDWTTGEKEQIRHRLGIDGDADAPSATPSLAAAADLATVDTVVDAIKTKTDNLPDDPADQSLIIAATTAIIADTEDIQSRLPATLSSGRMRSDAEAISASTTTADSVEANIGNLDTTVSSRATAAQVNAEVVDALNVDTYAEPGQGAPPATTTLVQKLGYLYKAWRNKSEQTEDEQRLYNDDGTTLGQKAAVSDDGSTFTRGEMGSGA